MRDAHFVGQFERVIFKSYTLFYPIAGFDCGGEQAGQRVQPRKDDAPNFGRVAPGGGKVRVHFFEEKGAVLPGVLLEANHRPNAQFHGVLAVPNLYVCAKPVFGEKVRGGPHRPSPLLQKMGFL